MIRNIFIRYLLVIFFYELLLNVKTILSNDTISPSVVIPNKVVKNTIHFDDKQKKKNLESNVVNHLSEEKVVSNWPILCMRNKFKTSKPLRNGFEAKRKESKYFKSSQVSATSVWDFGGTWSSELAGVRFVMDSHSAVGIDDSIPVKILDIEDGTKSNGFLSKGWMAKANAQYGRLGPVSLSAINRADKNVAVFIGFVDSQNNKDFVTGMWSMGRNSKNNLDTHQSVFNIPDVLYKDNDEQASTKIVNDFVYFGFRFCTKMKTTESLGFIVLDGFYKNMLYRCT